MTEWLSTQGYEGWYEVSGAGEVRSVCRLVSYIDGRVRAYPSQILSPAKNTENGYLYVSLWRAGISRSFTVQSLVASAFIGPRPKGLDVCHEDGVKTNNHKGNLRYDTRRNNHLDKHRHGTSPIGERSPSAVLTEQQVIEIRELISSGWSLSRMARRFGVSNSAIQGIRDQKTWTYLGPVLRSAVTNKGGSPRRIATIEERT